jgi:hypothetical protein
MRDLVFGPPPFALALALATTIGVVIPHHNCCCVLFFFYGSARRWQFYAPFLFTFAYFTIVFVLKHKVPRSHYCTRTEEGCVVLELKSMLPQLVASILSTAFLLRFIWCFIEAAQCVVRLRACDCVRACARVAAWRLAWLVARRRLTDVFR